MARVIGKCALVPCGVLAALLLAGCSSGTPAYVLLENSIKHSIVTDDQRPVRSVACAPHVQDVSYEDGYVHLNCVVSFTDGSSYSTDATIQARSYQVSGYNFEFDEPGLIDITTAPLPPPKVAASATSSGSLFHANNLQQVVDALKSRFSGNRLILSMALYPGELEAVIGANGEAQLVTAHSSGALTVGPQTQFDGQRSGIEISQLNPRVPEQLVNTIAAHGGLPIKDIDRLVLGSAAGGLAIWKIYPTSGTAHFQAHIQGDSLERVVAARTIPLRP